MAYKTFRSAAAVATFVAALACGLVAQVPAPAAKPDSAVVKADIEKAKKIAGTFWTEEAHFFCEARLDRLQAVLGYLLDPELHGVPGRERLRVQIVAEHPGATAHCSSSRGSTIFPVAAAAATV